MKTSGYIYFTIKNLKNSSTIFCLSLSLSDKYGINKSMYEDQSGPTPDMVTD